MPTPQEFVAHWQNTTLGERQSYQIHFMEICDLVGHERPSGEGVDSQGRRFGFESSIKKDAGGQGFADVFYEGFFAIEYKAPGKYQDLNEAYQQLLQYREKLNNPPLLVVTDIQNWEIHTNWPNTEKRIYKFTNAEIATERIQRMLTELFTTPERLHPHRNTEQVTTAAAEVFRLIADDMRRENPHHPTPIPTLNPSPLRKEGLEESLDSPSLRSGEGAGGWGLDHAERIAHFLTKLVFCLFAEDVSLLPPGPKGDAGIFGEIIEQTRREPTRFQRYARELFQAMADGGDVMFQKIPYFNGSLFDDVTVESLSIEALGKLEQASKLNWESVEPAIFGTLFERSLDPSKRAQLGAHYTSRDDILLIVEPVLMQPLRREWEAIQAEAAPVRAKLDSAATPKDRITHSNALQALRERMLKRLREIKVLDPACGSGNFLYVSLQLLMSLEKEVITHDLFAGLTLALPEVHPKQMYGIEINPIAHDLASIVVWIGYIQWRQNNGYATLTRREPILQSLRDNIRQMDAIISFPSLRSGEGLGVGIEPDWPEVDVIVGNPPFLGGNSMRGELGDEYVENLRTLYAGRVPGGADFVTYWYEKARAHIEAGKAKRAGLLATNSIRGGSNREVLKRIKQTGDIFMAWSDREWVLDGAAVRVSMIAFDKGESKERTLDGLPVLFINADLTANVDITIAPPLPQNARLAFQGPVKVGTFDIANEIAQPMLQSDPENFQVIKPYMNGDDIVSRSRNYWLIDFGSMTEDEASYFRLPFQYVEKIIKPIRLKNNDRQRRENWWRLGRSGEEYRQAISGLNRQIFSPRVAKHRIFIWVETTVMPSDALVAIARDDDYFFGVLHSRLHEVWSLRMGTSLEDRPRYTPTTTFETFPFPWSPGHEDTSHPAYVAISAAAKQLHEERSAWLNGSDSPSLRSG